MASFSGSYKINTVIAHTAPAVLELLQGGVARSKNDIIAALAGRYSKNDIRAGSGCLDRFSGLIGGVSAGFRPPRSAAAE
jgi:hypothetical protein